MTHAMFFVTDEFGAQISDELLGKINDFNSYSVAAFALFLSCVLARLLVYLATGY